MLMELIVRKINNDKLAVLNVLNVTNVTLLIECSKDDLKHLINIINDQFKYFQSKGYFCRCETLLFTHKDDQLKVELKKK